MKQSGCFDRYANEAVVSTAIKTKALKNKPYLFK